MFEVTHSSDCPCTYTLYKYFQSLLSMYILRLLNEINIKEKKEKKEKKNIDRKLIYIYYYSIEKIARYTHSFCLNRYHITH